MHQPKARPTHMLSPSIAWMTFVTAAPCTEYALTGGRLWPPGSPGWFYVSAKIVLVGQLVIGLVEVEIAHDILGVGLLRFDHLGKEGIFL